ncbi:aldehyde dehydrogenase family protein [Piscinibacter koreensis]|uniref:Aldehyde dehydrogenase family protein n=1 Tax=Piscinibacter koreensis TaxID=2742824 RepID=A0A7Y6TWG6_9BURK|nr:aldehyde dehydrogenase family protein [Schlegelella koreensis]NUZ06065.1 aldehyde dehydrogenase family protein [Schlegelella koreensis]
MDKEAPSAQHAQLLIDGRWVEGCEDFPVFDKFNGSLVGRCERASKEQVDAAVAAASRSFESNKLAPYDRYRILMKAAELIEARRDEFARTIVAEAGFPYVDAENEVTRAAQTFIISAEEGKRLVGEMVPIEAAPGHAHRMAFTIRVPRGVVCGITSFNSPLNMVAHKVAPALASGNTMVVKPPQVAPLSGALLAQVLLDAGLPPGHLNLVQGPGSEVGGWLVENKDIAFYSFTGSTPVGKSIRDAVGLRPVALELGSIAATLVCADADLDRAATRSVQSAFRRAGQACTSVQRLFVDRAVIDAFVPRFVAAARALKVGDPHDRQNVIGPLISERDAARALAWVDEAIAQGARLLHGGTREGALMQPTILTDVRPEMRVICDEIFGPVVSVIPVDGLDDAVRQINATPFGLAVGVFTRDVMTALNAARRLHVGVVHINEPSSSRVDLMPFSGVKDSGVGTEGPRYAMREMTEERLITASLS